MANPIRGAAVLRIGLAIYLMIVMAAGPWLCCCAVRGAPATAQKPATPAKAGCCHRHAPAKPQSPVSNQAEDTHSPAKRHSPTSPGCPCQGDREPQWMAVPETSVAGPDLRLAGPDADLFAIVLPLESHISTTDSTSASRAGRMPFVTSRDLLRVFHILRC